MDYLFKTNTGNYTIPIPTGYSIVPEGEEILEGDLYLKGGSFYTPYEFLIEFKPFENINLSSRIVTSDMLIIRSII